MKSIICLATALLAAVPQVIRAERPAELQLALRLFRADGSPAGVAMQAVSNDAPDRGWLQFSPASCGVGAGSMAYAPSAAPGVLVWRLLSGHVVEQTADHYAVDLEMRRMDGATSQPISRHLTSRLGERVLLDEARAATSRCDGWSIRVEATVVLLSEAPGALLAELRAGAGTPADGARSTARGSAGSLMGAAATLVGLTSPPMSNGMERSNWASGADALAGVSDPKTGTDRHSVEIDLHALAEASFDAELWLVDTSAGRPPQTLQQTGHLDASGRIFQFPLLTVLTAARPVTMDVAVNLRPMATADNRAVLRAAIARVVDRGQSVGLTSKAIPMPGPTAVVSFEMPAGVLAADVSGAHHQELRVRIAQGKGPVAR
jgi:hypothetical protein